MKEITIDMMHKYSYLSSLQLTEDETKAIFIETKVKEDKSDYKQSLYMIDTELHNISLIQSYNHKVRMKIVGNRLYELTKDKEKKTVHTILNEVSFEDGKEITSFELPLAVSNFKDIDDKYYLVQASITLNYPDYHHKSYEEQLLIEEEKKENEDYVVFDEYPFFFNGAGIINKDRNTLFLVDKKTLEIIDFIPYTLDVESYDVKDNKIIYSGVDYTDVKWLWSCIWEYDVETKTTKCIYDDKMQISRVFFNKDEIHVLGTFGKEYGAIQSPKLYILKDKEMVLNCDCEYSMYNSVGTDCRYGVYKNYLKHKDISYFITTKNENSVVLKYENNQLKTVVEWDGTVDDFVVSDKGIYAIGLKNGLLQEVYYVYDDIKDLTSFNKFVEEEYYIAKANKLTVNKQLTVDGWVLYPKDYDENKTYPAILDIHGGPKCAYGTVFYHEMQVWASQGYFVMYCNPRGSDGKGNAFADLRGNMGTIDYEDIMDFVDEVLKQYPMIDKDRLAVTGGSYGGYMTNWIIGHTTRFKAAAAQRSISNRLSKMMSSDYGVDLVFEQEFKDIYNCAEELWDISPLKYVNNAITPTLFIHSTNDYRCPISEAIQMYTALKCRGVETKIVGFIGENHELSRNGKPLHRIRRLKEITEWINKYCK